MNLCTFPRYLFISAILPLVYKVNCELATCTSDGVTVEQVTNPVEHGEGPHWDSRHQQLYFVDISGQTVNRYDAASGDVNSVHIDGGPLSPVIGTKKSDWFFVGRGLDLILVHWIANQTKLNDIKVVTSVDNDKPKNRFNDGKADASGRMWIGTMGPEDPVLKPYQGSLYSFDQKNNFLSSKHLTGVSVSNGLGWNHNDTLMYYIDSISRNIDLFDFDLQRGSIRNRRMAFSLDKYEITGIPDGMAVDSNDNLWVAVYGGGVILNVNPSNGQLIRKIQLPVSRVTSCAFGGPSLNILYVTTSKRDLSLDDLKSEPLAGSVFALHGLNIKGQRKTNTVDFSKYIK